MPPPPQGREPGLAAAARLADAVIDLVLPADCVVCAEPATRLCPACEDGLAAAVGRPRRVEQGARALPLGPDGEPLPVVAAGAYEHPLSTAVLAFKDHQALHLRSLLGGALARAVASARLDPGIPGARAAVLVPVPGGASGFRRRGYDPLAELARSLPEDWVRDDVVRPAPGWPTPPRLAPGWLAPSLPGTGAGGDGPSHAGAGVGERRARARRWRIRPGRLRPGSPVLLVDDVLTTGATLAALDAAVRRAGGQPVGAVVVAAVLPPAPGGSPATAVPRDLGAPSTLAPGDRPG